MRYLVSLSCVFAISLRSTSKPRSWLQWFHEKISRKVKTASDVVSDKVTAWKSTLTEEISKAIGPLYEKLRDSLTKQVQDNTDNLTNSISDQATRTLSQAVDTISDDTGDWVAKAKDVQQENGFQGVALPDVEVEFPMLKGQLVEGSAAASADLERQVESLETTMEKTGLDEV